MLMSESVFVCVLLVCVYVVCFVSVQYFSMGIFVLVVVVNSFHFHFTTKKKEARFFCDLNKKII